MKILYCIPNLKHGGAERQTSYLAAELARRGHDVHVASRASGPNLERIHAAGAVWHCLGKHDIGNSGKYASRIRSMGAALVALWKLVALIRKIRPDIVQTILAPMDILGGSAALLTRTPWVLKESSAAILYTNYRRYWLRFAFGTLADALISNSAHGREYWRKAHIENHLYVIPNAVPIEEIQAAKSNHDSFNFRPDDKVVLYAGRIDIGKNVEGLISALAQIRDLVRFKAVICGDGTRRRDVETMAEHFGIANRVLFTGYVDHLWELMNSADAFVSLSRCEGSPNVVLEAMACECPLVISDIPGHREILDDQDALFVKLDEPAETARAILATLTDVAAARARANLAFAKVASRPSLEAAANLYEKAYTRILEERAISYRKDAGLPKDEWKVPAKQGEA